MYSANDRFSSPLVDVSAPGVRPSSSLTYEPFFGLREKPFSLSADPRFLFRGPAHAPAFDEILTGIRRREGLIVLTGEIGTGKTTLCRSVLGHLDRRTFAAFVADPFVSREDLLKTLLVDFGVISIGDLTRGRFNGASRSDLSYPLYEFLDSLVPLQAFAVLVIDEAQNLSLPLLEEIRILSELERREKLLQVVLVGQPELRENLRLPQMRQVDQRVSVRCELSALDAEGVAGYVTHRLAVAGLGNSRVDFTAAALEAVHHGSSGVPRLINRICDRTLQRAYAARTLRIDAHFVNEALADLALAPAPVLETRVQPEPAVETPAPPSVEPAPQPAGDAQAQPATPAADAIVSAPRVEVVLPPLADFVAEADHDAQSVPSPGRSGRRQSWAAAAFASLLGLGACAGGVAWYAGMQTAPHGVVMSLLPATPASAFAPQAVALPSVDPVLRDALQTDRAATVPASTEGDYTIVVASFVNRARAERLVEELTKTGYRAHAVERDWGPPRGRMVQVNVGGYDSAIEVQRDLQTIRELPGGYTDARIVERQ